MIETDRDISIYKRFFGIREHYKWLKLLYNSTILERKRVLENTISDWNSKNTKGEIYMSKVLENTISDWNKEVAPDLAKDL